MYSPFPPLLVREITFSNIIGTPQSPPDEKTIIGLLKKIILIYQ